MTTKLAKDPDFVKALEKLFGQMATTNVGLLFFQRMAVNMRRDMNDLHQVAKIAAKFFDDASITPANVEDRGMNVRFERLGRHGIMGGIARPEYGALDYIVRRNDPSVTRRRFLSRALGAAGIFTLGMAYNTPDYTMDRKDLADAITAAEKAAGQPSAENTEQKHMIEAIKQHGRSVQLYRSEELHRDDRTPLLITGTLMLLASSTNELINKVRIGEKFTGEGKDGLARNLMTKLDNVLISAQTIYKAEKETASNSLSK